MKETITVGNQAETCHLMDIKYRIISIAIMGLIAQHMGCRRSKNSNGVVFGEMVEEP